MLKYSFRAGCTRMEDEHLGIDYECSKKNFGLPLSE